MITKSNKIFLRRKPLTTSFYKKNQESVDEGNWKIGASIRNNDVCRGLTFDEEEKFLPQLLGVQPKNDNWQKVTSEYWNSISKNVPEIGIELEIGFLYKTEEDAKLGENCKEEDKFKYGFPLVVVDYILYRYCLVYSHVANSINDVNKSLNIRFYLHSKAAEIKASSDTLKLKNKAYSLYLETLANRTKVENLIRLFDKYTNDLGDEEQDIILSELATTQPAKFISYATDKTLEMKSFILSCIFGQKLKRIENTETIMYGETTLIGHTLDEAVANLNSEKMVQILNTLKIQMGVVKAKDKSDKIKEAV